VNRGEQPGDLTERPELEGRVVELGLPLPEHSMELDEHGEPERDRNRVRLELPGQFRPCQDRDFRLPAG